MANDPFVQVSISAKSPRVLWGKDARMPVPFRFYPLTAVRQDLTYLDSHREDIGRLIRFFLFSPNLIGQK